MVGWTAGDGTTAIHTDTFEADTDAMAVCHWSGTFEWPSTPPVGQQVAFRMLMNGIEICEAPFFTSYRYRQDSVSMVGAIPVVAGNNQFVIECRFFDQANSIPTSTLRLDDRESVIRIRYR